LNYKTLGRRWWPAGNVELEILSS